MDLHFPFFYPSGRLGDCLTIRQNINNINKMKRLYVSAVYGNQGLDRFEIREEEGDRMVHSFSRKEIEKNLLFKYINKQKNVKRNPDRKSN